MHCVDRGAKEGDTGTRHEWGRSHGTASQHGREGRHSGSEAVAQGLVTGEAGCGALFRAQGQKADSGTRQDSVQKPPARGKGV